MPSDSAAVRTARLPEPATTLTLEMSKPAREQVESAEPAYLTALQVANFLQLDEKTVLRWSLQDASMPGTPPRSCRALPRERLLAWLERQEPRSSRRSLRR